MNNLERYIIFLFLFAYLSYFETFLLYGVYDTTNFAVFDNWDPSVAVIDMIWGGVLFCLIRYTLIYNIS